MISKLLIKTVKDTVSSTPLVAGKHLLSMNGFKTFSIVDETITFLFDQEDTQVELVSTVVGDSNKASEIIYEALSNNFIADLDLSPAGYEINSITLSAVLGSVDGGKGGDTPLIQIP